MEHYLTFNPSDAVVLPKREKPEIEILTREEQAKLIQASYQFRYGIFIRLTLTTGMRLGEVLGLKWENIDLRSGILNIRQTLNRLEKIDYDGRGSKTEIVFQVPKTKNSIRSIPLLPFMIKELQDWKNAQISDKSQAGAAYQDMGMVVTNPLGGYIEPRTFKDYYNKILQAANIGHFTFHALRHTFCTRALENDMDAKTVSTIMGHYSVAFTLDVYGHVMDSRKREEMMKMEGLFELPIMPPQQQSYPVVVSPNANGFILNVIDFATHVPEPEPQKQNVPTHNQQPVYSLPSQSPVMPVPTQTPQQDSTQIIASAISSLKETADSIIASQSNDRKTLEVITKENTMLRMNIHRMKQNRSESRFFTESNEGVAVCVESNGVRQKIIHIGIISITKVRSYKIFKNGNYADYIFITYYDSNKCERNTIFTEDELTNKIY